VNITDAPHATALRNAIDGHRAEAIRCLEARPAEAPATARVDLHITFDAHGRAARVDAATHDAAHLESAATCISAAARRWRLPAPGVANAELYVPYVHSRATAPQATHNAPSAAPAHREP
jgi:hypothetical protein